MKKLPNKSRTVSRVDAAPAGVDGILPEYDFSGATRNKYASQYSTGSLVVVLEPDVAAAFPTGDDANEALRALAGIMHKHAVRGTGSRRRG
jgi:hypothetical protein